ncbi:carbon-nitrogen hydrolase [Hypoxylon crocopeplum]|nr:carbon-nitrogen hydrolase [Hypoxylon crocopeplum]
MRLGLLQFAPQVGDVDNNLNRADAILNKANPEGLDLLVLPELAFTGYNFRSLRDISPFLEPTGAGITSVWARTTALKHNTIVIAGYPERVDISHRWPTSPEYYNSAIIVNQDGDTIGHYRKSHLYYTDETWALEGSGFYNGGLPGIGKVAMGICNPYRFEVPWHAFEFAFHVLDMQAKLVIVSMAWLTTEDLQTWSSKTKEPCLDSLTYWVTRLEPLIRVESDEEIIVVFCNRTGVEDEAVYAGTSAVIGIKEGEVSVYDMLSRGDKELLVVDTNAPPKAKLVYRPEEEEKSVEAPGSEPQMPPNDGEGGEGSSNVPDASQNLPGKSDGPTKPNTGNSDPPVESDRRSFKGHVFLNSDTLSTSGASIPRTEYDESPVSPRYFWKQPPSDTPTPSQLSGMGAPDTYEGSRAPSNPRQLRSGNSESKGRVAPRSVDLGVGAEFSGLVNRLTDSPMASEAAINRPSSTKSRNASRRQPHSSQPMDHEGHPAHTLSRSSTGNHNSDTRAMPKDTTPDLRQLSLSPDLEKLGADLMVFEGDSANRQKRDSLVCHVDEDDYVILRTERKDIAGRKKPSKPDAHAGHHSSRSMSKSNDSPKQGRGRSHSRNKVLSESSTYPLETGDRTLVRPASRGRHRSDSTTSPKNLSKKHLYGHMTPNGVSPRHEDVRGTADPSRYGKPQGESLQSASSSPFHRHRQDPATLTSKPTGYRSPEPALPVRTAKHQRGDSRSGMPMGRVSSPVAMKSSPAHRTSPETRVTTSKAVPERVPPTPKAMVLPPDYDGDNSHQTMPTPPKNQQQTVASKFLGTEQGVREMEPCMVVTYSARAYTR